MKKFFRSSAFIVFLVVLLASGFAGTVCAAAAGDTSAVTEKICQAVDKVQDSLDISAYGVTEDQMNDIYLSVKEDNPQFFYLTHLQWEYGTTSKKVKTLQFTYSDKADSVRQMKTDYEAAVTKALSCVSDGMSDAEKVAAIHDYLVLDTMVIDEGDISKTAYGALVRHKGAGAGYVYAFKDLMTRLGITCIAVYSPDASRLWNMVQLDGVWYHVDTLWDDPTCSSAGGWHDDDSEMQGRVIHKYLLLSDEAMRTSVGKGWAEGYHLKKDSAPAAGSKAYDGKYSDISSGMFYCGGYWYYSLSGVLTRSRFDMSDSSVIPADGSVGFISLADNQIYYISTGTDGTTREIRRVGTDGTGDAAVIHVGADGNDSEEVTELLISDGVLQYTVYSTDESGTAQYSVNDFNLASLVTGVSSGGSYNSERTITFAEGTATLDGASFTSGGTVSSEGNHKLVVTDTSGNTLTISFDIDKTPPVVSGVENNKTYTDVLLKITFDEGSATMDGEYFSNGGLIDALGTHTLVVTDAAGNATTVVFTKKLSILLILLFVLTFAGIIGLIVRVIRMRTTQNKTAVTGAGAREIQYSGERLSGAEAADDRFGQPSKANDFQPDFSKDFSEEPEGKKEAARFCGMCGSRLNEGDVFCGSCGAPLEPDNRRR